MTSRNNFSDSISKCFDLQSLEGVKKFKRYKTYINPIENAYYKFSVPFIHNTYIMMIEIENYIKEFFEKFP